MCHRLSVLGDRTLCKCGAELIGEEYQGIGDVDDSSDGGDVVPVRTTHQVFKVSNAAT